MNQETLTRLDWVIEAVGKAPTRQFNMDYWQHRRWFCGTSHCAIGWACQDERVQASGMRLSGAWGFLSMPRFDGLTGFDAIAKWLDIPQNDVRQLFGPRHRSGKSKEEVLKRLYAYRDLVSYELARQAPQVGAAQREEDALPIAERIAQGMSRDPHLVQRKPDERPLAEEMARGMGQQPAPAQQANPATTTASMEQVKKAPQDATTSEVDSCES